MKRSIVAEVARLRRMTVGELRTRYTEVFGEEPRSRNKDYLWKRIAFRVQALAEGGITERARQRADELANEADLRIRPAPDAPPLAPTRAPRDPRLPSPGTVLRRTFAGKEHEVRVLEDGFEYQGRRYKSLSSVAREIAGSRWNGFLFFGLASNAAVTEATG